MKDRKEYDYHIFLDYSENLIGYNIIEKKKVKELLLNINKLKHYKNLKHKREYLNSMKNLFVKKKINTFILKMKIFNMRDNIYLFSEILEFIKKHNNCVIFISVDDFQFKNFKKLVHIIDSDRIDVVKESKLKKGTPEYQMSLVIDTKLNLIRRK
jgi:hypothetical protein